MSGFASQWLSLREPADTAARAAGLIADLRAAQPGQDPWRIVDLGAGTGANLRYLAPRLGGQQHWTLVDNDAQLLGMLPETLARWAHNRGLFADADDQGVRIHGADLDCRIEWRQLDLAEELPQLELPSGALVTASALLDLVSAPWIEALAHKCAAARAPVLFALSYDGRVTLTPGAAQDARAIALLNRHQLGDKGFGPALGPQAGVAARQCFAALGYGTQHASSDWQLGAANATLQSELMRGWFEAACAMAPDERHALQDWHAQRRASLAAGELRITVGHEDLLALPGRA
jgi:hypothetical protein